MALGLAWLALVALRACFSGRPGYLVDASVVLLAVLTLPAPPPAVAAPLLLPAYLAGALLLFGASVWMTAEAPRAYWSRLRLQAAACDGRRHVRLAARAALIALHEELVWRLLCQSALAVAFGPAAAVAIVALAFTLWHRSRIGGNLLLGLELGLFAIVVGVLFAWSSDLLLVMVLHATRNYLIVLAGQRYEVT